MKECKKSDGLKSDEERNEGELDLPFFLIKAKLVAIDTLEYFELIQQKQGEQQSQNNESLQDVFALAGFVALCEYSVHFAQINAAHFHMKDSLSCMIRGRSEAGIICLGRAASRLGVVHSVVDLPLSIIDPCSCSICVMLSDSSSLQVI